MTPSPQLSAEILGQIALMQSVVAQLPDQTSMMQFTQKGLRDIFGVQDVSYEILIPPEDPWTPVINIEKNLYIFQIHYRTRRHGAFHLKVADPIIFEPYRPYIENFCNMLALIFEDHQHREREQRHREELEHRVTEQTAELRRFKVITDKASYGALICTMDGVMDYVNEQFARMHGYRRDELIGQNLSKLHNNEQRPRIERLLKNLVQNQEFTAEEVWHKKKDGSIFPTLMSVTLIHDENGTPIFLSGSATDISEIKAAEAEKNKIQAQINQAQRLDSIGQLAGGVAHDFNNMLAGIIGAADVLKMQSDTNSLENPQPMLDLILRAAERAGDLTRKLLSFARLNPMDLAAMDLHQAVKDTVALLSSTLDKRIRIVTELDAPSSIVVGDPAQLQNVFLNLGINASHAMPEGGTLSFKSRIVDCTLSSTDKAELHLQKDAFIEIEVNDTGSGIAPEHLPFIFDPFFTTKAKGKGTGLGLSAAMGTIQQHKGTLRAYSEIGQGSSFKVTLPLDRASQIKEGLEDQILKGTGTILLVDDEIFILEIGKQLLKAFGYNVISAQNGAEAVELYQNKKDEIDLIILDMVMPIMNGRDAFNKIQKINPLAKVILSSGFSKEHDIKEMKAHGLLAFIKKPFRSIELNRLVFQILHQQAGR